MFERTIAPVLFASALAVLGLLTGCGEKYRNDAEKQFLKAAKKGDAEAQYELGGCYEFGGGAERDIDAARKWYAKAAAQGHKKAAARLRLLDPPKPPTADEMKEYRRNAGKGDAEAMFQLAQCFEFGYHGPRDPDAALRNYSYAAKKGHEEAGKRLETMKEELTPSEAEVKKYFADARKGIAEAQYQAARCLEFGFRVKANSRSAGDLYRKAAAQGHPKALARLGRAPKRPTPPRKRQGRK